MSGWEKFKKFIKNPGPWLWAFLAAFAVCAAAAVIVALIWNGTNPVSYFLYALMLALAIYCICAGAKPAKACIIKKLHSNRLTANLISDYGYRTVMFSLVSAVISGAYALFLAVLGAVYSSAWYGLFGGYYIVLTAMRALVIFGAHRIGKKYAKGQAARARTKLYFGCGAMLIVLALAFTALASVLMFGGRAAAFGLYGAIIMACYTFYKIIISAINALKTRKYRNFTLQSLRNINFADALVSLFALEIAMIATVGAAQAEDMTALNIAMGGVVFALTFGLGVYMMASAAVRLKKLTSAVGISEEVSEQKSENGERQTVEERDYE